MTLWDLKKIKNLTATDRQARGYNKKPQLLHEESKDLVTIENLIVTNCWVLGYDRKFDCNQPLSRLNRATVIKLRSNCNCGEYGIVGADEMRYINIRQW